ncbi:MAG: DUF308 domain-containing protein [Bacteroidetes bacterium]|nr:DUF308 domain-containing protein [Bacteroidota bacterium]MCK4360191.1 DUF308 domain-containing protein [Bacteroidales bacterium]MCK4407726.1 DUF308 domain-containing protein [Bacteroidales bacterium]
MEEKKFKKWWVLAVNGLIALLLGILIISTPATTLIIIGKYFGLVILVGGLILLFTAFYNIKKEKSYGLILIESVITIILGILILIYTRKTLEIFVILIGIWAIIIGISQLAILIDKNYYTSGKYLFLFNGLLTVVLGVFMLFNPFAMGQFFITLAGIGAIVFGILLILFAFKIKERQ